MRLPGVVRSALAGLSLAVVVWMPAVSAAPDTVVAKAGKVEVTSEALVAALQARAQVEARNPAEWTLEDRVLTAEQLLMDRLQLAQLEARGFDLEPWFQTTLVRYAVRRTARGGQQVEGGEEASDEPDGPPSENRVPAFAAPFQARQHLVTQLRSAADIRLFTDRVEAYRTRRSDSLVWDFPVALQDLAEADILATIDGKPVTVFDLEVGLYQVPGRLPSSRENASLETLLIGLNNAIDFRLLSREAIRLGAASDPVVRSQLERLLTMLGRRHWGSQRLASEADLQAYYQLHIDEFTQPAQVVVLPNVFPVVDDDREQVLTQADEFRNRLLAATPQQRLSMSPTGAARVRGGMRRVVVTKTGPMLFGPDARLYLLALDKGAVGPLLETDDAFYVPVVIDRRDGRERSYEEVQAMVQRNYVKRRREVLSGLVMREALMQEGYEVDREAIAALPLGGGGFP